MTSDNGSNWSEVNFGMPDSTVVLSFVVNENHIYAGTEGFGTWKIQISDTITTIANSTAGGTTSGGGIFTFNQTCAVKAIPNSGYHFDNWTVNGDTVSLDTNYTFTTIGNKNLQANFSSTQGINNNDSLHNFSIIIQPNPATSKLTINLQQLTSLQNTTVSIYDMQGKLLLQKCITQPQTELNIASLAKGIYIVKVTNDTNSMQSKFVKE